MPRTPGAKHRQRTEDASGPDAWDGTRPAVIERVSLTFNDAGTPILLWQLKAWNVATGDVFDSEHRLAIHRNQIKKLTRTFRAIAAPIDLAAFNAYEDPKKLTGMRVGIRATNEPDKHAPNGWRSVTTHVIEWDTDRWGDPATNATANALAGQIFGSSV